jgi:hypothetical protein
MSHALLIYARVCGAFEVLSQNAVKKSFEFLRVPAAAQLSAHDDIHLSLMDRDTMVFSLILRSPAIPVSRRPTYPTNFDEK